MSAPETATRFASAETSSVAGGQLIGRSNKGAIAPKEALKLRLDLNLEVEIAIQAKVNGDITLSLLFCGIYQDASNYCKVLQSNVVHYLGLTPPKFGLRFAIRFLAS
ncbi:uncharacterized protein BT62DRAFT_1080604 [Guyanagaster necrorhizus]|uniref:Uncharacterized protein n=1 Tax=Guyanagaster necrorhizus TaxID=856835 RepID=A0A9P7VIU2_9AGAR|nr:uncharacterized protein BT62DRAFT_1080604 [Guyanagaster necrorhizus MCA 3950]KAG7440744.1 hypothetical protein BT62DRAFT_1080604 [Guyanagaster necrorhizus MCA 3950]